MTHAPPHTTAEPLFRSDYPCSMAPGDLLLTGRPSFASPSPRTSNYSYGWEITDCVGPIYVPPLSNNFMCLSDILIDCSQLTSQNWLRNRSTFNPFHALVENLRQENQLFLPSKSHLKSSGWYFNISLGLLCSCQRNLLWMMTTTERKYVNTVSLERYVRRSPR